MSAPAFSRSSRVGTWSRSPCTWFKYSTTDGSIASVVTTIVRDPTAESSRRVGMNRRRRCPRRQPSPAAAPKDRFPVATNPRPATSGRPPAAPKVSAIAGHIASRSSGALVPSRGRKGVVQTLDVGPVPRFRRGEELVNFGADVHSRLAGEGRGDLLARAGEPGRLVGHDDLGRTGAVLGRPGPADPPTGRFQAALAAARTAAADPRSRPPGVPGAGAGAEPGRKNRARARTPTVASPMNQTNPGRTPPREAQGERAEDEGREEGEGRGLPHTSRNHRPSRSLRRFTSPGFVPDPRIRVPGKPGLRRALPLPHRSPWQRRLIRVDSEFYLAAANYSAASGVLPSRTTT